MKHSIAQERIGMPGIPWSRAKDSTIKNSMFYIWSFESLLQPGALLLELLPDTQKALELFDGFLRFNDFFLFSQFSFSYL
jgi:hypothetical protein